MTYSEAVLRTIYDKTEGYCYYCGKKLAFYNRGAYGEKGAWHVEHKNPKSATGSDYMRNLVAACVSCNLDKLDEDGRSYKSRFEPVTIGGKIVKFLDLPEGFLGASRRKKKVR